jgi:hypothetical protein
MAALDFAGWRRWLLIGAAVLVGAVVLLIIDPSARLLLRVVGVVGTMLLLLSIVIMLLTFRKARRLSPWMLALSGTTSVVATSVFFALAGAPLPGAVLTLAVVAGALVGIGWSLTNLLFIDGEAVRARGNAWYLAVWGAALALPQLTMLLGGRTPDVLALVSFLGMGLAVGNSAGLLTRYHRARRLVRAAMPAAGGSR